MKRNDEGVKETAPHLFCVFMSLPYSTFTDI